MGRYAGSMPSRSSTTARRLAISSFRSHAAVSPRDQRVSPRSNSMQRIIRLVSVCIGLTGKSHLPFFFTMAHTSDAHLTHLAPTRGAKYVPTAARPPAWIPRLRLVRIDAPCERSGARASSASRCGVTWNLARCSILVRENFVNQTILNRLLRSQEVVAVSILLDALTRLTGVTSQNVIDAAAQAQDLTGRDFDIRRLSFSTAQRLVNQHGRIGQTVTFALFARGEQYRSHAHSHADAHGGNIGLQPLHGVIDGKTCVDHAAGRVDVQPDVLGRVLALEEQQLRHRQVSHIIVDGRANEND